MTRPTRQHLEAQALDAQVKAAVLVLVAAGAVALAGWIVWLVVLWHEPVNHGEERSEWVEWGR